MEPLIRSSRDLLLAGISFAAGMSFAFAFIAGWKLFRGDK